MNQGNEVNQEDLPFLETNRKDNNEGDENSTENMTQRCTTFIKGKGPPWRLQLVTVLQPAMRNSTSLC